MSEPLDLDAQLRSFGATLERTVGEPITPSGPTAAVVPFPAADRSEQRRDGRRRQRRLGLVAAGLIVVAGTVAAVWAARGPSTEETPVTLPTPVTSLDPVVTSTTIAPEEALVLDVSSDSLAGVPLGVGQGAEDILLALEPVLGPPDFDSGWVEPGVFTFERLDGTTARERATPCQEVTEYREFWWDDLTIGTWQAGSREYFHFWHLGDRRLISFWTPEVQGPGDSAPSGLRSEHGIGIGDPIERVEALPRAGRRDTVFGGGPNRPTEIEVALISVDDPDAATPSENAARQYFGVDGSIAAFGVMTIEC